jgi:hypothetical protein
MIGSKNLIHQSCRAVSVASHRGGYLEEHMNSMLRERYDDFEELAYLMDYIEVIEQHRPIMAFPPLTLTLTQNALYLMLQYSTKNAPDSNGLGQERKIQYSRSTSACFADHYRCTPQVRNIMRVVYRTGH